MSKIPAIKGLVTRADKPVGGAYVRLTGPSGDFVSEQYTQDEGEFAFYVAEGSWTLEVRAAGAPTATQTVDVAKGEVPVRVALG